MKANIGQKLAQYAAEFGMDMDEIEAADLPDEDTHDMSDLNQMPELQQMQIPQNIQQPPAMNKPPQPNNNGQKQQQQIQQQQINKPQQAQPQFKQQPQVITMNSQNPIIYRESVMNEITQSSFSQVSQLLNLDLKTFVEYFQSLLLRHRQYLNYVKYMSENMFDSRQQEIAQKSHLIQQCDIVRNDILSGRMSINLCEFVNQMLPPIRFEDIHKYSEIVYNSELSTLVEYFENQIIVQQQFLSLLKQNQQLNIKKGNKKIMSIDYMKQQIKLSEEELKYLQTLNNNTPLPKVAIEESIIETSDNKDIPKNTLRIRFKRILLGPQLTFYVKILFLDEIYKSNYCNNAGIFNYSTDVKVEIKQLSQLQLEVRVMQLHHLVLKKEVLLASISLTALEWSNSYEGYIAFPQEGYPDCKIEFQMQLREPINKTLNQTTISIRHIVAQFPPFNINAGKSDYEGEYLPASIKLFETKKKQIQQIVDTQIQNHLQSIVQQQPIVQSQMETVKKQITEQPKVAPQETIKKQISEQSPVVQIPQQQQQQQEQPKPQEQPKAQPQEQPKAQPQPPQVEEELPADPINIIIHGGADDELIKANEDKIPEGLTLAEVLYPEDPKKSPVFQFVVDYKKFLERQMMTLQPKERRLISRGPMEDFMRQEILLNRLCESGQGEKYLAMIKDLPERESKLMAFYELIKSPWLAVVAYRKQLLDEELQNS